MSCRSFSVCGPIAVVFNLLNPDFFHNKYHFSDLQQSTSEVKCQGKATELPPVFKAPPHNSPPISLQ